MSFWEGLFRRKGSLGSSYDIEYVYEYSDRLYLKEMALETNISFIARTISQSNFRFMKNKKRVYDDWDYLLNIRPNKNQSAAEFWQIVVYKMIYNNEVLVILSDDNDLLIADSFSRVEYAVYQDVFKDVTVKDYTFKRSFQMDEVLYLSYNNEDLTEFTKDMFEDYSDLFARMIETQKLSNQIRSTVSLDSNQPLDTEGTKKLQGFIDKLFDSFKKNVFAIVPLLKGFSYNEVSSGQHNGKSVDELGKLQHDLVNVVANILGIPNSLIHGEMAEYETAIKAYIKFCIAPLVKKIHDELNAKLISKKDYMDGKKIEVRGVADLNPLELATAVDKLRSSGTYSGNEIRIKLGDEPVDDPLLDEYVITKNYQTTSEGGGTK